MPYHYVADFHRRFGLPNRLGKPVLPSLDEQDLRRKLLIEEYGEYLDAVEDQNLVEIADALADMVYVIYGTALTYGIDLDAVLSEVHRSNMTKLEDGKPIYRADGKVAKGREFQPPNIREVLGLT